MAAASSISKALLPELRRRGGGSVRIHYNCFSIWWFTTTSSSSSSLISAAAVSSIPESQSSPDYSSSSSYSSDKKIRASIWSKWLLFLPGAITFGLGTWQIIRRQEKIKTLEYREKRLKMEPLELNNVYPSSDDRDSLEFRRVFCRGVFDEKRSIYVGPRSRSISGVTENGYYVITPLVPITNHPESLQFPILVNRGWVPRSWKDKSSEVPQNNEKPPNVLPSPHDSKISSWWRFWSKVAEVNEDKVPAVAPAEVVGVARGSEKPSIFVPPNDPNSSQWFYVDVPAIASAAGLPENTIYIEDINDNVNPSNPYPVPKDVNMFIQSSVMPQDHLNYTFTWYTLSTAVTYMAYKRINRKRTWR